MTETPTDAPASAAVSIAGPLAIYVVCAMALYAGRWWVGDLIERARNQSGELPGLAIFAIERLSGPGWIHTMGALGAVLAVVLARRWDKASTVGIIAGLALYAVLIWLIAGDLLRAVDSGDTARTVTTWVSHTVAIWSPVLALSAIRIAGWVVTMVRARGG